MSRCFPFPPPGYEKKAILDDTDLQIKEKHKDKKHKKDKKDKEKREGKEKKDRERSKDKEKKDRKEKHKDKKDKDRDKEKRKCSDEKKVLKPQECHNDEKLSSNSKQGDENRDSKFLLELGKRIRDEGGATESQVVHKITVTDQRSSGFSGSNSVENKEKCKERREEIGKANGQGGATESQMVHKITVTDQRSSGFSGSNSVENKEKCKERREEIGKANGQGGATESQMVNKITVTDQRSSGFSGSNSVENKEKYKERREEIGKANGQRTEVVARGVEIPVFKDYTRMDQQRVEVARLVDKDVEKQREGKEKDKHKDSDSKGDKHKDRDKEKKGKSKDKKRHKEKKKEEKAKEKDPNKQLPNFGESGKDGVAVHNIKPPCISKESDKGLANNGILGKRKELVVNGFLHDNEVRPNKLPRPVSSSHQVVESERKLEPCKTALKLAFEREGGVVNHKLDNKVYPSHPVLENGKKLEPRPNNHKVDNKFSSTYPILENGRKLEPCQHPIQAQDKANNHKKDNKERRTSGKKETEHPNVVSTKPLSAPLQAKVKVEASVKPPHPDSKYLSQILSVPEAEESLGFDDQEWLFNRENLREEKPKLVGSSEVDGAMQVWGEAFRIESADVTALPYVIPY